MASTLSREQIIDELAQLELDWGDEEDAELLVDLLLRRYRPFEVLTWLLFLCDELGGTPIELLTEGRGREVFREARQLVEA